jgi:hypothetical protein
MQTKREIHELVDRLPESETGAAARYLEFLLAHDEAAIDPGMLKRIDEARARRGPGIPARMFHPPRHTKPNPISGHPKELLAADERR